MSGACCVFLCICFHPLLLFISNMETKDIVKHHRALDTSDLFWQKLFGISRQLAGDFHRSLRGSFGNCSFSPSAVTQMFDLERML